MNNYDPSKLSHYPPSGDLPFFSIITIAYNNLNGLKKTEISVKSQSNYNYEWIIIDGSSIDGTKEYMAQRESKSTIFISEPDFGIYDAMNKGIERATGQFLIFMNSGDEFANENVLQDVFETPNLQKYNIIYGDSFEEFREGDYFYKRSMHSWLIFYSIITHHQSIFYRRDIISNHKYNLEYKLIADRVLTHSLIKRYGGVRRLSYAISRFESGGISQSTDSKIYDQIYSERLRFLTNEYGMPKPLAKLTLFIKKCFDYIKRSSPSVYKRIRYGK